MLMQRNGVIFDLDGTLWDVTDVTLSSADEITAKRGLPSVSKAAVLNSFGLTKEGSAANFFPDMPLKESVPLIEEIISRNIDNLFVKGGNLYPDLTAALAELKCDYDLFIVTNSPQRRYAESFIVTSHTEEYFKNCFSAGELGMSKADAIAKIVTDYKLPRAVYVGDTQTDYDSAAEAGIAFIYADYGYGHINGAEFTVSGLKELPAAVKRVFSK